MKCVITSTIICFLAMVKPTVAGADLVHNFKSPAFTGQGYSAHMLSLEQLTFNRKEDIEKEAKREQERIERELENTVLNKFIRNLESRIYATLSKQLVDNMFAACGEEDQPACSNTGTTEVEGSTITWTRDETTGSITLIVDGPDGYTEITIPGAGDFTF